LAASQLSIFLDQVEMAAPWDFIALQEGFRVLEGLDGGGHGVFTPPELEGGLRCPVVVVHSRRAETARYVGGRVRWVAVDVDEEYLVISAHLPHIGKSLQEYASTLEEIKGFVSEYPKRKVLLGGDLNVKLAGTTDNVLIGPSVPRANLRAQERERASLIVEFVAKLGLIVANTFANCNHEHLMTTRTNWSGRGTEAQIDFVLASANMVLTEASVEQYLSGDTDHRLVNVEFTIDAPQEKAELKRKCIKHWRPDSTWEHKANSMMKDWATNWEEAAELLRSIADDCKKVNKKNKDKVLQDMLAKVGKTPLEELKALYKSIWRRRRFLKRQKHTEGLQEAAATGRAPPGPRPSMHLNWGKSWATRAPCRRRC
jgi:endonuclease/exonuclease/phosphatase family metal-dependent hydrolase